MRRKILTYTTRRGYVYGIEYRMIGPFLWEYDVLVKKTEKEDDWLGLTFGEVRALFPKRRMVSILVGYSEQKDDYNEENQINLDSYREF